MKIFIASSKESIELVREIEIWLQDAGHDPLPWDQPGLFPPGGQTFLTLINISKQVGGAICVFGEDDKVWYREDTVTQPRDNVLIEYGLFVGALSPTKAIICRHGTPKSSTDLHGITTIDLNQTNKARGKFELRAWAKALNSVPDSAPMDPMWALRGRITILEQEKQSLEQRISFEKDKFNDLAAMLQKENVVDFSNIVLEKDGYWKLLFEYMYFKGATEILAQSCHTPASIQSLLISSGANEVAEKIAWKAIESNMDKNYIMAGKVLRVFRGYFDGETFSQFIANIPEHIRNKFTELAYSVLSQITTVEQSDID